MTFLHRNMILNASEKYQVDPSIIDYNLTILDECVTVLVNKRYEEFPSEEQPPNHRTFAHVAEWQLALECFLQFDDDTMSEDFSTMLILLCLADVFLLKTSTFGSACTRTSSSCEGLFCIDVPRTRYRMMPCEPFDCPCCRWMIPMINRSKDSLGVHRFINGYQAYMNGPVVSLLFISPPPDLDIYSICLQNCQSANLVYVLTCHCGKYDYIGETQSTVRETFMCQLVSTCSLDSDALMFNNCIDYRRQSCRVIQQMLLDQNERIKSIE